MQQLSCWRIRNKIGLAIFAGLVVLANVGRTERLSPENQGERSDQQPEQNASAPAGQASALEIELKKAEEGRN